jgi:hypothetical protein
MREVLIRTTGVLQSQKLRRILLFAPAKLVFGFKIAKIGSNGIFIP